MIPLAERLRLKAEREAKLEMKLSGKVKCFTVRIPFNGYPRRITKGDLAFHKRKAKELIDLCCHRAGYQFYEDIKDYIKELEEKSIKDREAKVAQWAEAERRILARNNARPEVVAQTIEPAVPANVEPAIPPVEPVVPPIQWEFVEGNHTG